MRGKALLTALVFCCATVGASHQASATSGSQDLLEQMQSEGWTLIAPGVLQRNLGDNKVETLGFGAEGLRFKLEELKNQLAYLRQEYRQRPTPELRRSIRSQRAEIERTRKALETASATDEIDVEKAASGIDCTIKYGAHVDAFPLSGGSQGVGATTDSYFNSNCGQTGEVYAHAYSKATGADNVIQAFSKSDPTTGPSLPRIGGNVTASAAVTAVGVKDCYSYSYATVTSYDLNVTYSQSSTNYTCPLPMTATITGPTSASISGYNCQTLTWSVSATGGAPGYTYTWYRDGSQVGTGSSYSRSFCGSNSSRTESVNLTATARDTASQTMADTHSATVTYSPTSTTTTTPTCKPGPEGCPDIP